MPRSPYFSPLCTMQTTSTAVPSVNALIWHARVAGSGHSHPVSGVDTQHSHSAGNAETEYSHSISEASESHASEATPSVTSFHPITTIGFRTRSLNAQPLSHAQLTFGD